MTESMLSLADMDSGLQAKEKLLSTETDFWRRAPRISRFREVRNVVTRKKIWLTERILKRLENVLQFYGGAVAWRVTDGLGE